jgi:hypothetical protein
VSEQVALFADDLPRVRWVVLAHRTASSMFGAACDPVRKGGGVLYFETSAKAEQAARRYNRAVVSPNVFYVATQARGS